VRQGNEDGHDSKRSEVGCQARHGGGGGGRPGSKLIGSRLCEEPDEIAGGGATL
jgi:hypothetical protein